MEKIEVVFVAENQKVLHAKLDLPLGATVADALNAAKVFELHPEAKEYAIGIYARLVSLDTVLKDGDRVELYRPLNADPKENRRKRARSKK